MLLGLLLAILMATPALAQTDITIREINAYPQATIDELNAAGAGVDPGRLAELLVPELANQSFRITAVVLSNPRTSGLGNPDSDGFPSRIHVYVRDTSAVQMGNEGMGIQLVDGAYQTTGLLNAAVGDVITVVGVPDAFTGSGGASMQFEPETVELLGPYTDFGLPDSILDPVDVAETGDVNMSVGASGEVQTNWSNLNSLNGQYIRIEGATIQVRDISSDRPNWLITTDGGTTVINFYDMSLRYRNDRDGGYNEGEFNVSDDDFEPPPPGSLVNIQGFLVFQGDDPFGRAVPQGALLSIAPFEDGDLEVSETPPLITNVSKPDFVPGETDDVTITADIVADPERTLTLTALQFVVGTDTTNVGMANTGGDSYAGQIPAQADGAFVSYSVIAMDNTDAVSISDPGQYRVLADGINEISDIQTTIDGGPGNTPFRGITTDMDITAIVHSNPDSSGIVSIQDNADLDPWSGIFLSTDSTLSRGDEIRITNATIDRTVLFGFPNESILSNVTLEVLSEGNAIYGYKAVTTDLLADPMVAKAHEGMLLRYDDVVVTNSSAGFGEWLFASVNGDGSLQANARADDASPAIGGGGGTSDGERLEFIQGPLAYAFNNFRIWPEEQADIGSVTNVATEETELPGSFALRQNYPNPFNPATQIEYTVPATSRITLEVFDVLGRSVAMLVDGQQAAGTHTVQFDASHLASGLYLYRLTAGSQVQVKKMMLLK